MNVALASNLQVLHSSIMPALRLRHSRRVGMMHQCSPGELLAGAALVHHDDKYNLLATSVPKGLIRLVR